MRQPLVLTVSIVAALAFVGCTPSGGADPTPDPTSSPTNSPSPSATQSPTAEPSTDPSPTTSALPQCSDHLVLGLQKSPSPSSFGGTDQAILAASDAGSFEQRTLIEGLFGICQVAIYRPVDPGDAVARISYALIDNTPEAIAQLETWAGENNFTISDVGVYEFPRNTDGTRTRTLNWVAIGDLPVELDVVQTALGQSVDPTTLFVSYVDYSNQNL